MTQFLNKKFSIGLSTKKVRDNWPWPDPPKKQEGEKQERKEREAFLDERV